MLKAEVLQRSLAAFYHLYAHAISGSLKYENDVSCSVSLCIGYKPEELVLEKFVFRLPENLRQIFTIFLLLLYASLP